MAVNSKSGPIRVRKSDPFRSMLSASGATDFFFFIKLSNDQETGQDDIFNTLWVQPPIEEKKKAVKKNLILLFYGRQIDNFNYIMFIFHPFKADTIVVTNSYAVAFFGS